MPWTCMIGWANWPPKAASCRPQTWSQGRGLDYAQEQANWVAATVTGLMGGPFSGLALP